MGSSLRILFVAAEAAPLVKTGGLADVALALPRALKSQGHDVRVFIPCHGVIPPVSRGERRSTAFVNLTGATQYGAVRVSTLPGTDVPLYLIEHEQYFDRPHPYHDAYGEYRDNLERFCFFSMAVLDAVPQLEWRPDVVHCHDWHTAAIPVYLRTRLKDHPFWKGVPSVFTIHNLGYQGRYVSSLLPVTGMGWDLFSQDFLEYYGDINLMKGGIAFATKINTVSRTYAREIQTPAYGQGLDGFLRTRCDDLSGIVNGIDYSEWNPAADTHIASPFSPDDLSGKNACKEDLRARLSLARTDAPLFAMVSRLVWEKGIDLMVSAMDRILAKGAQLVVLGKGDPRIELAMEQAAARYPDQVSVVLGYDEALAHRIYAGADFFVMPSQTEPCGLSQMYSLKYGAIPVVRKTGGLADTVTDVTPATLLKNHATGIVFRPPTAEALGRALERAMRMYQEPDTLRAVQRAGMRNDLSWDRASREYADLYRKAIAAND